MKSRCVVASMAALLLGLAASSPVAATRGELTKRDLKALDRAAHAYFSGNTPSVLEGLVKLVARLDDDQFMAAEAILAGRRMPDVKTLLTRARLTAVRYGQPAQLTVAGAREVVLVLPELQRQVDTILDEVLDEPIMQDPLPQPNLLTEFEKLFWDAHVLENRLQSAAATAGYTQQLVNRVPRRQIEKLSDDQQRILRFGSRGATPAQRVGRTPDRVSASAAGTGNSRSAGPWFDRRAVYGGLFRASRC